MRLKVQVIHSQRVQKKRERKYVSDLPGCGREGKTKREGRKKKEGEIAITTCMAVDEMPWSWAERVFPQYDGPAQR